MMNKARTLAIYACAIVGMTRGLDAQTLSQYRNFELGSNVSAVAALAGIALSGATTTHRRPALLQDLEWRPSRWIAQSTTASTDPVEEIRFSFYNDQLFRVVVDYGDERTAGMTQADMIEGISAVYGAPLLRTPRAPARTPSRLESESGSPLARWGDGEHAVMLYQTSAYGAAFRLIVINGRLDDLARKAEIQALQLDAQEAPRLERARQKKESDEREAGAAKARAENKGAFRP
jgi:hypothetical protein